MKGESIFIVLMRKKSCFSYKILYNVVMEVAVVPE